MLTTFLIIVIVVLLFMWLRSRKKLKDLRKTSSRLIHKQHLDYQALDQGMSEITDAYRSDELQWMEANSKANELIERQADQMRDQQNVIQFMQTELDNKQAIIDEHNQKCLPRM